MNYHKLFINSIHGQLLFPVGSDRWFMEIRVKILPP